MTSRSADQVADQLGRRAVSSRRVVHAGMIADVVRETVDFTAEISFDREYVLHPGAAAVVALDEEDRVLMIRQYRHAGGGEMWEIPAGLLDVPGEDPALAARRELEEETGCTAAHLEPLLILRPSPGGSDEVVHVYLARGVEELGTDAYVREDEESEILVRRVPLEEAVLAVLEGRVSSATAVAGILAARSRLSQDRPSRD